MAQTAINTGEVSIEGTIPISGTITANQGAASSSAWPVDASGHTVPVSAASLPLPSNAAEETGGNLASLATHQTDGNQKTQVINFPITQGVKGTKTFTTESTIPLAGNATFTGAWHDSSLDGTCFVEATFLADVNGAVSGCVIQESDDNSNSSFTRVVRVWAANTGSTTPSANQTGYFWAYIRSRYWRIVYKNGVSPQTSFELNTVSSNVIPVYAPSPSAFSLGTSLSIGTYTDDAIATFYKASFVSFVDNTNVSTNVVPVPSQTGQPGALEVVVAGQSMFGGAFSGTTDTVRRNWSYMRTPTVFRQASTASSGSTTLWTPASGNKFRLLRFKIQITADATLAVAGDLTVSLLDNASDIALSHIVFVPSTATPNIAGDYDSGWIDLGTFGILSASANNPLKVNLSSALTAGKVNVIVCGTEE